MKLLQSCAVYRDFLYKQLAKIEANEFRNFAVEMLNVHCRIKNESRQIRGKKCLARILKVVKCAKLMMSQRRFF